MYLTNILLLDIAAPYSLTYTDNRPSNYRSNVHSQLGLFCGSLGLSNSFFRHCKHFKTFGLAIRLARTTEISIRNQFKTNNELVLANDAVAELLVKAADANAEFSAVESEKLYAFLYPYINTWTSIEIAYENGMLPRATFDLALDDVRIVLQYYPAPRPVAREVMVSYPSEADSNVYAAMRQELEDVE